MKCAIILVAACLAVVIAKEGRKHHEETPEMKKWKEECAKENNIDLTKKPKKGDKSKKPEITKDFKCFKKCIATKGGLIDQSGKADYNKIKEQFKLNDTVIESLKNCTSAAADACDNYFEREACSMKLLFKGHRGGKKDKKE